MKISVIAKAFLVFVLFLVILVAGVWLMGSVSSQVVDVTVFVQLFLLLTCGGSAVFLGWQGQHHPCKYGLLFALLLGCVGGFLLLWFCPTLLPCQDLVTGLAVLLVVSCVGSVLGANLHHICGEQKNSK